MHLEYGAKEMEHLKKKDKKLGEIIDELGFVERKCDGDLFTSVVYHIIGQQISIAAQKTIWKRISDSLGEVTAENILTLSEEEFQKFGLTFRKVEYIMDFAHKVNSGELDLEELYTLSDEEVVMKLSSLKGIGVWTAEMIMLFCMKRENIFSFGDLAIHRGLRMVYHHRKVDRKLFEKYRRRYSPYCTVASVYLWAVAGGMIPGMKDYAPKKKKKVEKK